MANLGELTKLLDQGYASGELVFSSKDGDYKFELKTIPPLAETEANQCAESYNSKDALNLHRAIEVLARSVVKVNGVAFEDAPGAEGNTALEKRRSLLRKFSEKLLIDLWRKFNELKESVSLDGSEEESEAVKK